MEHITIGYTHRNLPIEVYQWEGEKPHVLVIGGVHGDESEGVVAAYGLIGECIPRVTVIPTLNLDGVIAGERKNAAGVDLNRNMPTKDWTAEITEERYCPGTHPNSEPETQALINYISEAKPSLIISIHSWKNPCINVNGSCQEEAQAAKNLVGYDIRDSIGYPTPGCLGTYYGLERDIPTITYEIERGLDHKTVLETHLPALKAMITTKNNKELCTKI